MGEYVRNITCTALILSALGSISGTADGVRKVVFGLVLGFLVIAPIRNLEAGALVPLPEILYQQGEAVRDAATDQKNEALRQVIKENVESYILVEASSLGTDVQVEQIELDRDTMVPVSVSISGDLSAFDQQQLSSYLSKELGIGKEGQIWIGQP